MRRSRHGSLKIPERCGCQGVYEDSGCCCPISCQRCGFFRRKRGTQTGGWYVMFPVSRQGFALYSQPVKRIPRAAVRCVSGRCGRAIMCGWMGSDCGEFFDQVRPNLRIGCWSVEELTDRRFRLTADSWWQRWHWK